MRRLVRAASFQACFPGVESFMYTASSAFLDALTEAGVTHLFVNFGSDHPAMVEAIAEARATGRTIPTVITCPNEMVALSAAHGFYNVTGVAQAVIVHVECGTQALAGAVHNADKGRIPVLIFAGASPFTQEGELKGSRNEFIQWIQDVHDQRGLVRGYMRYDNELRTGQNVRQLTHRALRFAYSAPPGPVYLMGAREVMEEAVTPGAGGGGDWSPIEPAALSPAAATMIAEALAKAERPLVVTSYAGRDRAAFPALVELCETLGVGVLESVPSAANFPHDNPLYIGNQWNEPRQNAALAEADCVLVVDSDVPWIPTVSRPAKDAVIFHIDNDPLKRQMPLWDIGATHSYGVSAALALNQITEAAKALSLNAGRVNARKQHYGALHHARAERLATAAERPTDGSITSDYLLATLRRLTDDKVIYANEGISNYQPAFDQLAPSRPGSMFASGGGSLGWNGGAAVGMKLARPDATIVALTGDGSYLFSVPSSVHWMARRYEAPILQIVFNNGGWKSPKLSTLAVHPSGFAAAAANIDVGFEPAPDYGQIAAASGGAWCARLERADEVEAALKEALRMVREEGRSAVLDVKIPNL